MSEEVWPGMGGRIGKRIKELGHRSVEKFTQAHRESEYSLGLVYKWIREEVAPSRASVLRLASDLECEPSYLFFGYPKPESLPIRAGVSLKKALPVGGPSRLKKNTTRRGLNTRKHGGPGTLCKVAGWTVARHLPFISPTMDHGVHRLVA